MKPLITTVNKRYQIREYNTMLQSAHIPAAFDRQEDATEYAKWRREHVRDFVQITIIDRDTRAIVFTA